MPRKPRVILPDHPHHVILRGNNRRRLFSYPPEYGTFIYQLGRAQLATGCELYAAALMANHVHLVVRPATAIALSRFVKIVGQCYAQRRNRSRCQSGRLFEERFFAKPIRDDAQLAVTLAYVELNPVRAGLKADVAAYRWSTYGCHVPTGAPTFPRGIWTPSPWYLSLGTSAEMRASRYAEWVRDCLERHARPEESQHVERRTVMHSLPGPRVRRPDDKRAA